LLLEECGDAIGESGRRYLRLVRESTQHMAQLIDDLLELSRVTRSELKREVVDLSALAQSVVGRLRAESPSRQVEVQIEPRLTHSGDPTLLGVVLANLLGNAWKYSSKRDVAVIELGRTTHDGAEAYFVRDNGAGFDMKYLHKLFGVFERLHSAQEFEGTGIGLATVRRIVERHGGRVWARGQVDAGATFFFTLRAKEAAA
jgi:light-regulated signal transduction histidine kinase (bacteriophytochrome)